MSQWDTRTAIESSILLKVKLHKRWSNNFIPIAIQIVENYIKYYNEIELIHYLLY